MVTWEQAGNSSPVAKPGLGLGRGWGVEMDRESSQSQCVFQQNLSGSSSLMDSGHIPISGLWLCVSQPSFDLLFQTINDVQRNESTDIYTNDTNDIHTNDINDIHTNVINDILVPSTLFLCSF